MSLDKRMEMVVIHFSLIMLYSLHLLTHLHTNYEWINFLCLCYLCPWFAYIWVLLLVVNCGKNNLCVFIKCFDVVLRNSTCIFPIFLSWNQYRHHFWIISKCINLFFICTTKLSWNQYVNIIFPLQNISLKFSNCV